MAGDKPQVSATGILTSSWLTVDQAIDYLTNGARTPGNRRIISPRFLAKEVAAGRLRAAKIGGRGQLFFTTAWLDAYMELSSKPVMQPMRRLA